jgi:hypothetical protein
MKGKRNAARGSGGGAPSGGAAKSSPRSSTTGIIKKSKDTRARIPVELLTKMVKMKLRTPQCRNKGFILDGYPRTLEESKALFGPDPIERDPDDPEGDLVCPSAFPASLTNMPYHVMCWYDSLKSKSLQHQS